MANKSARPSARAGSTESRKDPVFRPVDGLSHRACLLNEDPNRFYVWVNKGDPDGFANYRYMQYQVEKRVLGGVEPLAEATTEANVGQEIEDTGMVLMSIPKALKEAYDKGGRDKAIKRARLIRNKSGGIKELRGMRKDLNRALDDSVMFDDNGSKIDIPVWDKEA